MSESTVICGQREYSCECVEPQGHDGPHACDEGCGGSWTYDEDGKMVVVSLPIPVWGAGRQREDSVRSLGMGDILSRSLFSGWED